jgi:hypothetical protein
LIDELEDNMQTFISVKELCSVLENMELRIRILKELMCSLDQTMQLPVRQDLYDGVNALVMRKSVSSNGCQGTP